MTVRGEPPDFRPYDAFVDIAAKYSLRLRPLRSQIYISGSMFIAPTNWRVVLVSAEWRPDFPFKLRPKSDCSAERVPNW
jgi:hypothetical protein